MLSNDDLKQYIQESIDSKKFDLPVKILDLKEVYPIYTVVLGWKFKDQRHGLGLSFRQSDPLFKKQIKDFLEYIELQVDYLACPEDFELRKNRLDPRGQIMRIKPKVAS